MAPQAVSPDECGRLLMETMQDLRHGWAATVRHWKMDQEGMNNMAQLHVLGILAGRPSSLRELAAVHHVTPSSMSRSIDLLVRKGWVARHDDPADRRQVILSLTGGGKAALDAMTRPFRDSVTKWLSGLDGDECVRLYDGLQVLRSLLARTGGDRGTADECQRWTAGPLVRPSSAARI